MSINGRYNQGAAAKSSATSAAEALANDDLTLLGLADLIQLPLAAGTNFPVMPAAQTAVPPENLDATDLSDLSLEQLLSLSVSGDDEPEDEAGEDSDGGDTASDESKEDGEGEAEDAAPDDSPGLFKELQFETVEWLSQDDELSLSASGHGFSDPGVATAGSLGSLRFGGSQTALGNQPVPVTLPPGANNPIQTWFSPFAIDLIDGTVGETWSVADPVGTVTALGAGAQVSYVLIDDAGGQFAINSTTGDVTIVSGPFDFTAQSSHTIVVEAVDGAQTVQQTFTIQVSPSDLDAAGLPGDQVLTGANGNTDDQLYGGAGNDTLDGRNGLDELHGGSGGDLLIGGNHDDTLFGGSDDDVLQGGNQADRLYGGTGNDDLYGGNQDDLLFGGGGADELYGGDGVDSLYGDGGSDWLDGGSGSDSLMGGADDDVLVWDVTDLRIDGGDGNDKLLVLAGDLDLTSFGGTLVSLESVDLLTDSGANTLSLAAADVLDMTENGLLTVLGDAQDTVKAGSDWTLSQVDEDGYQLYIQTVGPDVVGLLLGPDVHLDPQDGG
jgi:Ca2+-binding RTX toxin-like protein